MIIGIIILILVGAGFVFAYARNSGTVIPPPKVDLISITFLRQRITVNRDYASIFSEVDSEIWNRLGHILAEVYRVDSYNPRFIFGTSIWSFHAYGQAVDINPIDFPLASYPYSLPVWYSELVSVMKAHGFRWGGDWNTKFDPMHFEIGERK